MHRINENVKRSAPFLDTRTEMVTSTPGRSGRAAGLSQMGYACFWPKGGGLTEGATETKTTETATTETTTATATTEASEEAKAVKVQEPVLAE